MEQYYPHYQMMWMNNNHLPKLHFHQAAVIDKPSWEEKAFADDAAGLLGASFMWPPRCYSCNFCRRDFRSAQALGGHMNVHRRERAKLKQSLTNSKTSTTTPHSSSAKVCFNPNPNPNANPSFATDALPSPSLSRVSSTISTQENSTSHEANVDTKLSMGLSLAVSQSDQSSNDVLMSLQPQKFAYVSERPSSSLEGIDLELRLGLPHH